MSQTIYARVPDHVKEAAEAYATENGVTLARAVAELLDRGLQATADEESVLALEGRVAKLTSEVDRLRQRDHAVSSAYEALHTRTSQPIGACPGCGNRINGHDLLVTGYCPRPECQTSLTALLGTSESVEAGEGHIDDGELKVLLGALGLLLGIAFVSQRASGAGGGEQIGLETRS